MQQKRCVKNILVTGGAGFMGSAFIRYLLNGVNIDGNVINLDALTYAANLNNLKEVENDQRYFFIQGNICDKQIVERILKKYNIDIIVNFAAETHVDRSIVDPRAFLETNIIGTYNLLEVAKSYKNIHFHHISTDEVYGSLGDKGYFFESSTYFPNSPYSASKASSDHFVRAYSKTYGISSTISHSSNNYGPCQNREKFIPLMILNCIEQKELPVYGKGINIRDWIYVDDHASAVFQIINFGKKGEVYDIGGGCERRNIDLLYEIIDILSSEIQVEKQQLISLIKFVSDRLGHDYRYAIDFSKMKNELNWSPKYTINKGLAQTIKWYLLNSENILLSVK